MSIKLSYIKNNIINFDYALTLKKSLGISFLPHAKLPAETAKPFYYEKEHDTSYTATSYVVVFWIFPPFNLLIYCKKLIGRQKFTECINVL